MNGNRKYSDYFRISCGLMRVPEITSTILKSAQAEIFTFYVKLFAIVFTCVISQYGFYHCHKQTRNCRK